jgi:hypothetical protein
MFMAFVGQLIQDDASLHYALSLSNKIAVQVKPLIVPGQLFIEFMHEEVFGLPGANHDGRTNSIDAFINELMKELKSRKVFNKKSAPKLTMPPMLVFIDDIFEVIMSTKKKTALAFIELLIGAAAVDMFFLLGSSGIYRNLLEQLINVSPSLKKKLNSSIPEQNISQPLGAELVMNPDGLLFFRERGEKIHRRLYPC